MSMDMWYTNSDSAPGRERQRGRERERTDNKAIIVARVYRRDDGKYFWTISRGDDLSDSNYSIYDSESDAMDDLVREMGYNVARGDSESENADSDTASESENSTATENADSCDSDAVSDNFDECDNCNRPGDCRLCPVMIRWMNVAG